MTGDISNTQIITLGALNDINYHICLYLIYAPRNHSHLSKL